MTSSDHRTATLATHALTALVLVMGTACRGADDHAGQGGAHQATGGAGGAPMTSGTSNGGAPMTSSTSNTSSTGTGGDPCVADFTDTVSDPATCCSGEVDQRGYCCTQTTCCGPQNHSHQEPAGCNCDPGYVWDKPDDQENMLCVEAQLPDLASVKYSMHYTTTTSPDGSITLSVNQNGQYPSEHVSVANSGGLDAPAFHVGLGIVHEGDGKSYFCQQRLDAPNGLPAGQTATWNGPFTCSFTVKTIPTGQYRLRVYADIDQTVAESTETNNWADSTNTFNVVGGDQDVCPDVDFQTQTACSQCTEQSCCAPATACVNDASCLSCWHGTGTNCTTNAKWLALNQCRSSSCTASCGGTSSGSSSSSSTTSSGGTTCNPSSCKSYSNCVPGFGCITCFQWCEGNSCHDGGCSDPF